MHLRNLHGHPDIYAASPYCCMLHMYSLHQEQLQGMFSLTLKK